MLLGITLAVSWRAVERTRLYPLLQGLAMETLVVMCVFACDMHHLSVIKEGVLIRCLRPLYVCAKYTSKRFCTVLHGVIHRLPLALAWLSGAD